MTTRLRSINPLQAGVVAGVLYFLVGIIPAVFVWLVGLGGSRFGPGGFGWTSGPFILMLPVLYGIFAFVFGIIVAALYNLVAIWTGGFEVTFTVPAETLAAP